MGNPLDPDVLFGPLADAEQPQHAGRGVAQDGATLRYGGAILSGWHRWQRLLPADHLHECEQNADCSGGNLWSSADVIPFDTEAEDPNCERHELWISFCAYCDIKKATRVANAMQAGTCWINCYNIYDVSVPFG